MLNSIVQTQNMCHLTPTQVLNETYYFVQSAAAAHGGGDACCLKSGVEGASYKSENADENWTPSVAMPAQKSLLWLCE